MKKSVAVDGLSRFYWLFDIFFWVINYTNFWDVRIFSLTLRRRVELCHDSRKATKTFLFYALNTILSWNQKLALRNVSQLSLSIPCCKWVGKRNYGRLPVLLICLYPKTLVLSVWALPSLPMWIQHVSTLRSHLFDMTLSKQETSKCG